VSRRATVEVFRDRAGKWRWRVRAVNGQITETCGESYASRANARRGAFRRAMSSGLDVRDVDA
jgi:uncharacterized protein YegP (UPF0339 family)